MISFKVSHCGLEEVVALEENLEELANTTLPRWAYTLGEWVTLLSKVKKLHKQIVDLSRT